MNFTFLINFTVAILYILYILIVKRFELYMDFALYKINIYYIILYTHAQANMTVVQITNTTIKTLLVVYYTP